MRKLRRLSIRPCRRIHFILKKITISKIRISAGYLLKIKEMLRKKLTQAVFPKWKPEKKRNMASLRF